MDNDFNLNFDSTIKASDAKKQLKLPIKTDKGETMETEKKTCAQLVYQKMQERNEALDELNTIIDDHESTEEQISEAREELDNWSIGEDSYKVVKIHLSTGGPADWIEVWMDPDDKYIRYMNYHYSDWFDHAETKIEENSYLWDYAQNYILNYA